MWSRSAGTVLASLALFAQLSTASLDDPFADPLAARSNAFSRRTTTNGTCISAPEDACSSLVGLCIGKVGSGQIASNMLWSDPVCFAAAVCAGSAPVVDAACCAGSCVALNAMVSLDYTNVYAPMVGSCAWQSGGCPVTWTDFVNYFYNTIQATNTNLWPTSGDAVLGWWANIATWTGFCSGTNCVNGQIPYLNLNDWLHFMWSTIISSPGSPPITNPPSTNRENNTDVWDPPADPLCPFDDTTLCAEDDSPPDPPTTADLNVRSIDLRLRGTPSLSRTPVLFSFKFDTSVPAVDPAVNLSNPLRIGFAHFQPKNIPPPVYIHGGSQQIHLNLNVSSLRPARPPPGASIPSVPHARPAFGPNTTHSAASPRDIAPSRASKFAPRALSADPCRGAGIHAPNPLPTLTYYCDYLPEICAGIRGTGKAPGDNVQLTYDPYNSGERRDSVCNSATKKAIQEAGGCDPLIHDPAYWKVSCDEFPMNSVLEGGARNGATTVGVPEIEQSYQSSLQSALSRLMRVANDKRTQWSKTGSQNSANPGMCFSWVLQLTDTRPAGTASTVVGTLDTGGAFLKGKTSRVTVPITNRRAQPPPDPLDEPTDYPSDATGLQPTKSYKKFDCTPEDDCMDVDDDLRRKRSVTECTASASEPTSTQSAEDDAADDAADAAAAAEAASSALSSLPASAVTAAQLAAAQAAVAAASSAAAAAAALAALSAPADIASGLESATSFLDTAQSAVAALTSLFGPGSSPPAAITSIISQTSIASSSTASVVTNMWNVKPPNVAPVPPAAAPGQDPNINTGPQPGTPAAACFPAGSQGFLKLGDTYFVNGNGNAPATLLNAGNNAFFGLDIPTGRYLAVVSGCNGVYAWAGGGPQPDFQVDCSTNEFGSYWNGQKLQCYYFSEGTSTSNGVTFGLFGVICGTDVSSIYTCAQENGVYTTLNPAYITWSTT